MGVVGPDVQDSQVGSCVRPCGSRPAADAHEGDTRAPHGRVAQNWDLGQEESDLPAGDVELDVHPERQVRLGLESVRGLGTAAQRIVEAREQGGAFLDLADLAHRAHLSVGDVEALGRAGATVSLGVTRRETIWAAGAVGQGDWYQPYLPGTEVGVSAPDLGKMDALETLREDYRSTGLTTGEHPFALARPWLREQGILPCGELGIHEGGEVISVAGVVTHRQRPHTARGVTFLSLEDETGLANITCSKGLWARHRRVATTAQALVVRGRLERADGVVNVVAHRLEEVGLPVSVRSRDFR
ncbi:MAG: hypothetical protein L0L69_03530 [Propionibacterium sp.]|nr:hypothetical protein [Propionibacterium sp.]